MTPVRGVVFADRNGDGVRQPDEPGVGGVVVAIDRAVFATSDADGTFAFLSPVDLGRAWARVPSGYRPGPAWMTFAEKPLAIPIVPLPPPPPGVTAPLTFVVAADTHVPAPGGDWDGGDVADAFAQAVAVHPRFFTVLGDLTSGNEEPQFERVIAALREIPGTPWVPVAGNHDWYDGGVTYRRRFGLTNYSFDLDDVHFVVWDTNQDAADQIAFLAQDLAHVASTMTIVALAHHSPLDEVATAMDALGVDYLFTGHWHANRRLRRGRMTEWSTAPMIMGGIDQSAPSYRVVTFEGGAPVVRTRERMVRPQLELVSPHAGSCVSPTGFSLSAAVSLDAAAPAVTARIDCGPELPLSPAGGWSFSRAVGPLRPGHHAITIAAQDGRRQRVEKQLAIEVCTAPGAAAPDPLAAASWPQLGGGPTHESYRAAPVTPPLVARWIARVGGTITLGSPVVGGGVAIVVASGDADRNAAVALDLATGAERWRHALPDAPVGAAAIAGDTVVIATRAGVIHAVDLRDGGVRWTRDVAKGLGAFDATLWAPPTIADGRVYVALQKNFTALDLATGAVVWSRDPQDPEFHWLGTLAPVSVTRDHALAAFNRTLGLASVVAATGDAHWVVNDASTIAINAAPLVAGDRAYVVNAAGHVSALDLATGAVGWTTPLVAGATEWHYAVTTTPALAEGALFVATQWTDLVALDATTGAVRWRAPGAAGPLNFAHYKSAQAGWAGAPVVTGRGAAMLVWIGGLDGMLTAFSAHDGSRVWQTPLGAPITSAPAPAGEALVVASYDGTVRLLGPGAPVTPPTLAQCPPPPPPPAPRAGCAAAADAAIDTSGAVLLALASLCASSRTRRRRRRSAEESRGRPRTGATDASRPRR